MKHLTRWQRSIRNKCHLLGKCCNCGKEINPAEDFCSEECVREYEKLEKLEEVSPI